MPAIFISYRRSDSEGEAGRLSDLLTSRFSGQSVFMDVDSIKPGRDFRRAIEESIQECSVLLAIIGPAWLEAATREGTPRLQAANDYVRLEIAAALQRDIPVIPVLIRGAHMPQPDQLPREIQELAYRNSVEVTHARWKSDLQVLIDALDPLLCKPTPAPATRLAPASRPASPAVRPASLPPATYLHATTPASLHTPPQPATTHPGPSARRAAYTTPLPRSPFADTPTTIIRPPRPSPAPAPPPLARAATTTPTHIPPSNEPWGRTKPSLPLEPSASSTHTPPQRPEPSARLEQPQPVMPRPLAPPQPAPARPQPETVSAPVATLSPEATDRISRELAHFIGPIAEIVVKRAARRSTTLEDLYASVATEIESAPDRARFLAQCRK